MKQLSKFISFFAALALLMLAPLSSYATTNTTRVTVNGMVCAFCAQGIEKRLFRLPATKAVFVDLKQKIVAVEAKEGMSLDQKLLQSEIVDAGYDVVKLEASSATVEQIRAEYLQRSKK